LLGVCFGAILIVPAMAFDKTYREKGEA